MAHADYDCCAVCDCKQSYAEFEAETKEEICSDCLKALRAQGWIILDTEELIDWIKATEVDEVVRILKDVGYSPCYYVNDVDDAVMQKPGHGDATGWEYKKRWEEAIA